LRRTISTVISILVLVLLLSSCSSQNESDIAYLNSDSGNHEKNQDITIQSPMTLSNNDLFPINGQHQYLRLKMITGKYYEDWSPGAYMGTIWEGYFILELSDESGNVISQNDLSKIYKEPLIFNSSFQIQFDVVNC